MKIIMGCYSLFLINKTDTVPILFHQKETITSKLLPTCDLQQAAWQYSRKRTVGIRIVFAVAASAAASGPYLQRHRRGIGGCLLRGSSVAGWA